MMGKCRGSFTVEAVFVVSILVIVLVWVMKEALFLYQMVIDSGTVLWLEPDKLSDIFRMICHIREYGS